MLKQDFILQTMNQKYHYLKVKIKKAIGLMKDELGREIMKEFAAIRAKTYTYLTDNKDEDKKPKAQKSMS